MFRTRIVGGRVCVLRSAAIGVLTLLIAACGGGGGSGGGASVPAGSFTLATTAVAFSATQNGAPPAAREIAMTITGGKVAYAGAAYLQGQTPASWLGIDMQGSGTSYRLILRVLTTSLAPGEHTATFAVGTADADGKVLKQQNFTVTYTLAAGVTLGVAPAAANFVYGDTRTRQDVVLSVTAPGQQWTLNSNAPWLQVPAAPQSGTTNVTATLEASALAPGRYSATVRATAVGDAANTSSGTVEVVVTAPTYAVTEGAVLLGGEDGRSDDLQQAVGFAVTTGDGVHPYVVELRTDDGGGWLTADQSTGFVGSNGAAVVLSASRAGLKGGTRTGEVRVTTTVKGMTFSEVRPVTFHTEASRIVTTAEGVGLSRVPGRDMLERRVLVLSTLGRTDVPWTATSNQPWLAVTATGSTGEEVLLRANPAGLANDTVHYAEVAISSTDPAVENVQRIRVGLHLASTAPATASVAADVAHLAASPVDPLVATTDAATGSVQLYDTHSGSLARTLDGLVARAGGMTFSGDGRALYVHDRNNLRVVAVSLANGATIATYDAAGMQGSSAGTALAYLRPDGFPMLVTPGSRLFDLASGAEWSTPDFSIATSAVSLAVSPDQSLVVPDFGVTKILKRSALSGGTLRVTDGRGFHTAQGRAGEACVSAAGDRIYTASGAPYEFPATSIATGQVVQRLPGSNYPNSMQCAWNGVVVGGIAGYYASTDIWVYDGPTGALLAQFSSAGTGYRDLVDRGLAVSADATRLVSAARESGKPTTTLVFRDLPPPP